MTVIGHQGRTRRHDGMAEAGGEVVAVAGGAAAGYDWPPVVRMTRAGADDAVRRRQGEAGARSCRSRSGSSRARTAPLRRRRRSRASSTSSGLVADGKDLAGLLDLGGDALGLEEIEVSCTLKRGQGRVQEPAGRPVGLDDAAVVGGVGEVAARAAGHEDLDAGLAVLLQQQHAPAHSAARMAAISPAAPAPTTTMSHIVRDAPAPASSATRGANRPARSAGRSSAW